jgi:hypothetical protein
MERERASPIRAGAIKLSHYRRIDRSRHSQRMKHEWGNLVGAAPKPCRCRNDCRMLYSRRHARVLHVCVLELLAISIIEVDNDKRVFANEVFSFPMDSAEYTGKKYSP